MDERGGYSIFPSYPAAQSARLIFTLPGLHEIDDLVGRALGMVFFPPLQEMGWDGMGCLKSLSYSILFISFHFISINTSRNSFSFPNEIFHFHFLFLSPFLSSFLLLYFYCCGKNVCLVLSCLFLFTARGFVIS